MMNGKEQLEKYKKIIHDFFLKKDKMILLLLCGILLLVICIPTKKEGTDIVGRSKTDLKKEGTLLEGEIPTESNLFQTEDNYQEQYTSYLEQKLKEQLLEMDGVGEVSVMITISKSVKQIIAKEQPMNKNSTVEVDSSGGNRTISELQKEDHTIYTKGQNGMEEPFVLQREQPEIEGVFIVADGGGDGKIQFQITEAVQALFGIESHKIKIVKRKS